MLKKLLKYDLIYVYKVLIVFYILSIVFAIITRGFMTADSTIGVILHGVSSGVTIAMIVNIIINNIMRLWPRFKINLYGDESYLTHTLPVSKNTLYNSKFLTSIISMFISIIVIGITLFIAYYSKENLEVVKNTLNMMASIYDSTVINFLIMCLLVFFLEMIFLLQCGYTGIILGHRKDSNKMLFSVLFGFGTYMISQGLLLIIMYIVGLFNSDVMNLFNSNSLANMEMIKWVMVFVIVVYSIFIVITYFINIKLFNKGVNVD